MRAERSVIGTRRSFCVCKLEGRFVVEHEAVMRTRDKKRKKRGIINKSRDRGLSDAGQHVSRSERGSEGSLHRRKRLKRYFRPNLSQIKYRIFVVGSGLHTPSAIIPSSCSTYRPVSTNAATEAPPPQRRDDSPTS